VPQPQPQPVGQNIIKAKQLFDTLDTSTMSPEELRMHGQLRQQLDAQPAVQAYTRGARGAAAGPTKPTSPDSFSTPSNAPKWLSAVGGGIASGLGLPTSLPHSWGEAGLDALSAMDASHGVGMARRAFAVPQQMAADTKRGYSPAATNTRAALRAFPGAGDMAADIGAPAASSISGNPVTAADNTDAARATTQAATIALMPKVLQSRMGGRVGATVLGRFPERIIGSVLGSESRPAARAVMAREIPTSGDPGNLPIENFHKNVTDEWNAAGQDVSRVLAADEHVNPAKTIDVQPLIEAPYSKRTTEVGKYARGETAIMQQLDRLTEHSDARQSAAAEAAGLKPGVNWNPGDPIPMTPNQAHGFTKDWRHSVAGGFERMDPTEQAVIGNIHDAIKTTVPESGAAMQDYHDLSRAKEALDEKVPKIQSSALIPSLIETARGATTRKVVGGAKYKVPVAYMLNRMAPEPYRYTGTYNPARLPEADASTLGGVEPRAPGVPAATSTTSAPAAPSTPAAPIPSRTPALAPDAAAVRNAVRTTAARAAATTPAENMYANAERRDRMEPVTLPKNPPTFDEYTAPANSVVRSPGGTSIGQRLEVPPKPEAVSAPTASTDVPPAPVASKIGKPVKTPRGRGTVTHSVAKEDGSTIHFVSGVKTDSGRTVVVEPPAADANAKTSESSAAKSQSTTTTPTAPATLPTFQPGDQVRGYDPSGARRTGIVKSVGVSPKHGAYVVIETPMNGTYTLKAEKVWAPKLTAGQKAQQERLQARTQERTQK
jgi:hypothetical protein